jgi:hypothetical protein
MPTFIMAGLRYDTYDNESPHIAQIVRAKLQISHGLAER